MDDFELSSLRESKNEWCSRLVSIFTPLIIDGVRSIFNESWNMCVEKNEAGKYLMTFQNLLSRVPKWNSVIIEEERNRIIEKSGCNYLEDLITCVHIIQLKVLTCIRVGNKQKQIDISIPKLDHFIHKAYIHVARKAYTNVYLFEKNINPLQMQKNARELDMIVQECILTTIRESIPTEAIIRAYMDETIEHEEEVTIEQMEEPAMKSQDNSGKNDMSEESKESKDADAESKEELSKFPAAKESEMPKTVPTIKNLDNENVITRLSFNDYDTVLDDDNNEKKVNAPKNLERLEELSASRAIQRKLEEEESDVEDRIKIHTDNIELDKLDFDIFDFTNPDKSLMEDIPKLDFEEL
jgi:hypothetical protein